MSNQEALNNLAILSEILVDVSKSHIMPKEAIDQIRKLDIATIYKVLSKQIELLELYKKQNENITSFDYWKVFPIDVIKTKHLIDEIAKTEQQIQKLEKEIEEMITHDEAREINRIGKRTFISALDMINSEEVEVKQDNKKYVFPNDLDKIYAYITQQEQFAKDVAVLIDTLNSIKTICNKPSPTWILSLAEISNRYIEIDNLINTYQEKLKKVGKE